MTDVADAEDIERAGPVVSATSSVAEPRRAELPSRRVNVTVTTEDAPPPPPRIEATRVDQDAESEAEATVRLARNLHAALSQGDEHRDHVAAIVRRRDETAAMFESLARMLEEVLLQPAGGREPDSVSATRLH